MATKQEAGKKSRQIERSFKVLCLTQDFLPNSGGIAVFLQNLSYQLCRLKHQVDVLTPFNGGCAKVDSRIPYRVYHYRFLKRLSSFVPICSTLRLYWQNRYDVIFIGHFMTTHALGALLLCKVWGVPYVILSHGNDLTYSIATWIDKMVARWLLRDAALMLGNSRFTVNRIRENDYSGPTEVLNPGVETTRFHPSVDTAMVRRKYELNDRTVLLAVSRLVAKKNVDGVLKALPKVIKKITNILFIVAGDGDERGRYDVLCHEMRLQHYVRFLGNIQNSQLPALYCASDLFVMPSYEVEASTETFGISFVEASACGLPVIGGRSGGTADAVIDGETGLLVDPHNVDEIAEAIIRLLTDRDLARRLGKNGRLRVEQELSWEKVGQKLERCLKTIVR